MIKYYKNGFSIFKVDLEKNEVTTVTNHPENKGVVYSFGSENIAQSMHDSFTAQLGVLRPGGAMTIEVTGEEYILNRREVFEYFASASINP